MLLCVVVGFHLLFLLRFARGVGEEKTGGAPSVSNEEAWGEFRRLCANIWEKQKSSLLKSTWSDGDEDEEEDFEVIISIA